MAQRAFHSYVILQSLNNGQCPRCAADVAPEPLENWDIRLNWYAQALRTMFFTWDWRVYVCHECRALHVANSGLFGKSAAYAGEMNGEE